MTILTLAQQTILRSRPHRTRLFLSIYDPPEVFTARINDASIGFGAVSLTYDSGSWTESEVKPGMTLLVGSTPSGYDFARIRVRSIGGSAIVVAENSVSWADNAYLTVLKYYEPWPVYPRIVLDVNNVPTFYKDYDIIYTDQNDTFDPVPIMGPHAAAMLNSISGLATLYFDGIDSYDLNEGGSVTAYAWEFEGGTPSTSSGVTPGDVTWDTPGYYVVSLTVTNADGKSFTGYRHVAIHSRPEGSSPPIIRWGLDGALNGDYSKGGWEGRIWMRQTANGNVVVPHAQVVIFSDDWYDEDPQSLGGNYLNRENTVFVGYVRSGSVEIDPETSLVSFGISSLSGRLSAEEVFSVSIQSKTDPGQWYELKQMTVDRALHHYMRWHSTIYSVADVRPIRMDGIPAQAVQFADFERSPLWQAVDQFISSTLYGHAEVDRQGQLWLQKKVDIIPVASRNIGATMQLTNADWMDSLTINRILEDPVSYVELGGIFYGGPERDFFQSVISIAPGNSPAYEGAVQIINGMVLLDQATTNQLVGDIFADLNKEFKEVKIKLTGNYRVFDIAPQERLQITLSGSDSHAGLVWVSKNFIPRNISFTYSTDDQVLQVEITCEEESDGIPGIAGPYPGQVPVDPPTPDPVPDPQPVPGTDPLPLRAMVAIDATNNKVLMTDEWDQNSPTWLDISSGLTGTLVQIVTDKGDGARAFLITTTALWRLGDIFGTDPWVKIYDTTDAAASAGVAGTYTFSALACDPTSPGKIVFTAGIKPVFTGPNFSPGWQTTGPTYIFYSTDGGDTIQRGLSLSTGVVGTGVVLPKNASFGPSAGRGTVTYFQQGPDFGGGDMWSYVGHCFTNNGATSFDFGYWFTTTPDFTDPADPVYAAGRGGYHSRAGYSDKLMAWLSDNDFFATLTGNGVNTSDDSGLTWPDSVGGPFIRDVGQALGFHHAGQYALATSVVSHASQTQDSIVVTANNAATWIDRGAPGFDVYSVVNLISSHLDWFIGGLGGVEHTTDAGVTWVSREGNLGGLAPGYKIIWMDLMLEL